MVSYQTLLKEERAKGALKRYRERQAYEQEFERFRGSVVVRSKWDRLQEIEDKNRKDERMDNIRRVILLVFGFVFGAFVVLFRWFFGVLKAQPKRSDWQEKRFVGLDGQIDMLGNSSFVSSNICSPRRRNRKG